jgi:hypothetical protein
LKGVIDIARDIDLPPWYDRVDEMIERRAAAQRHRGSRKKGKRSNLEGERSNLEGERSNLEGERSSPAHEGDKNSRAGAAERASPVPS